jgi:hypothetical protein
VAALVRKRFNGRLELVNWLTRFPRATTPGDGAKTNDKALTRKNITRKRGVIYEVE